MKIAIDIDDVLSNTVEGFIEFSNANFGTSLTRESFNTWYWAECLNIPESEVQRRVSQFVESPLYEKIGIVPGALEGVGKLAEEYDLMAVTSRWGNQVDKTGPWIDMNFPGTFRELYFAHHPIPDVPTEGRLTKLEICREYGANVIIDDYHGFANLCASGGMNAIVLDNPWNRVEVAEGVVRAFSWEEVPDLVKKFKRE